MKIQVLKGGLAFMLAVSCPGCNQSSSSHEVARVLSPNGTVEAVLTESNGGATTSFGYDVSVGPQGIDKDVKVATLYGAIRNEQAYGVNLRWADNNTLQIQYLRAKAILNVLNTIEINGQHVQVVLESGHEDAKAPPGGMFFNSQKQSR